MVAEKQDEAPLPATSGRIAKLRREAIAGRPFATVATRVMRLPFPGRSPEPRRTVEN